MSVKVNYKGEEILSADTDVTKTLKTSGKYCEDDIEIVNTQDGGGQEGKTKTFTITVASDGNSMSFDAGITGTFVYLHGLARDYTTFEDGIINGFRMTTYPSSIEDSLTKVIYTKTKGAQDFWQTGTTINSQNGVVTISSSKAVFAAGSIFDVNLAVIREQTDENF